MTSFFAQIMQPGGGLMLLPFVRTIICCLLALTGTAAFLGVARIHMIVLTILSSGLLGSLYFFESEFKKVNGRSQNRQNENKIEGNSRNKEE